MPTDLTAAVFGLLGVLVGGLIQFLTQELSNRRARATDTARVKLLIEMLNDPYSSWRKLDTCARVIGADRDTTIRLLIQAGARASEHEGQEDLWGLVERHPFRQSPRR